MAQQLSFDWPTRVALEPDDFFVSDANAAAYAMVSDWENWPDGKLALIGPQGSGKSHLARVFQHLSGAQIIAARDLGDATLAPPEAPCLVVEDVETLPHAGEEWLFHAHNHLRATGGRLLVSAASAPTRWNIALPDLASRMQGTSVIRIGDPDDTLLGAVLMKQFQDRQLSPDLRAFNYLLRNMPRSFEAVAWVVAELDHAAMAEQRSITVPLARVVLDKLGADGR
ncbi:chromosomal replication initiator DnaA [Octadecabacter sp. R77987]|uniref:HdaA/DnaA family protein n=1 Tax=Octadecabacter sp. R77987 TaxID=3093874 RepID=UPI00366D5F02